MSGTSKRSTRKRGTAPRRRAAAAYQADLAFVHHGGFTSVAEKAATTLLAHLAEPRGRLVVDVGTGSGVAARRLSAAGCKVIGIDPSPAFVSIARRIAPKASFRLGSFAESLIPPCDAILAVGEVLSYVTERRSGWREVLSFFDRAWTSLAPNGVLLFDVASPGRVPAPGKKQGHAAGEDWVVVFEAEESDDSCKLTRRISTFRKVGRTYRRADETHRLSLYSPSQVTQALRAAGFRVRHLRGYDDLMLPRGWNAFLARKVKR